MGAIGLGVAIAPGRRLAGSAGVGFDLSGAMLPAGAALTRASAATCFDTAGVLVTRGADVARIDHDPVTGVRCGVLIEAAATNLLPWSADLASGWTRDAGGSGTAPVVTANDAVAPDGTMKAARIGFVRGDGFARIAAAANGTVPGTPYTFSVWLKAEVAGASVALRLDSTDSGMLTLTRDWRRYRLTAFAETDATSAQMLLWSAFTDAPATAVIHAWGAQLEAGGAATSLIATAGAAATRAADALTLDWGTMGVGDGAATVRYGFDDGGNQAVPTVIAGGTAVVPTGLARPHIVRATRV